jgi:protein-S-isoprenylcysteine O-methyltransferase Ste14
MTNRRETDDRGGRPLKKIILALRVVLALGILLAILFLPAGRLNWVEGWVFLGFYLCFSAASLLLLRKFDPELLKRRAESRKKGDARSWDKVLVFLYSLVCLPLSVIGAGLNERYGWLPRPDMALRIGALAIMLAGGALVVWAMISNTHFEAYVRIQDDRNHRVVSDGPYRLLRHPGYAGMILFGLALPLCLGSMWALIPAAAGACLMTLRTALEDRFLRRELDGYREYAQQVRQRLLPGIW